MDGLDGATQGLLAWGHGALALCAALYLAWWWVFFRPQEGRVAGVFYGVGVACIVGAALAGIGGAALVVAGLAKAPTEGGAIPGWAFAAGAVIVYVALAFATVRLFRRPVTTELMLFVAWTALELAVASGMHAAGAWSGGLALAMAGAVLVVMAASLVCYVLYYRLAPTASFVDGAVPLALAGAVAVAMAVTIATA